MSNNNKMTRNLSLVHVLFFGLAFMSLTTVFSTFGIATQLSHGMVPGAYILALIVMLFTAYSYGQMAKKFPVSGSAYTYAQNAFNPEVGFLVGWGILMDYLFIPMVNYLLFGIFFNAAFPAIPVWLFILVILGIVTIINMRGIKIAVRANLIVVVAAGLFLIIFCILSFKTLMQGEYSLSLLTIEPFFSGKDNFKYLVAGAALLSFSFLGFDSVSTFSEETKNATKNIPRAIMLITLIGGLLFAVVSYFLHSLAPNYTNIVDADSLAYSIIATAGGPFLETTFLVIYALTGLGSAISSQASGARVLFAMGRDGQLPKSFFGKLHPKYKTPMNNILLISVLSLTALFVSLSLVTSFINFGAFLAFIFVNLSVILVYYIKMKRRSFKGTILYLILPAIGVVLDIWLLLNLDIQSIIFGSIWFALGMIYLLFLTKGFKRRAPRLVLEEDSAG